MLFKIALKNIRKSFYDYTIYFLTLTLSISMFYVFNVINIPNSSMEMSSVLKASMETAGMLMKHLSVFVFFALLQLTFFANRFLIKQRGKELGMYLLLGLEEKNVIKILLYETLITGSLSLLLGLVIGVVASQAIPSVLSHFFGMIVLYHDFVFSTEKFILTIVSFLIIFLVTALYNVFVLKKTKIIDLLKMKVKNKKVRIKNLFFSALLTIVSCLILGFAYHIVIKNELIRVSGMSLLLGFIGTILFFYSSSSFFLNMVEKIKKIYLKKTNMFTFRQLNSSINASIVSITVISLLLFIGISASSISIGMLSYMNQSSLEKVPYDVNLYSDSNIDLEKLLSDNNFDLKDDFQEYLSFNLYKTYYFNEMSKLKIKDSSDEMIVANFLKESEYNKFTQKFPYSKMVSLDSNQATLLIPQKIYSRLEKDENAIREDFKTFTVLGNWSFNLKEVIQIPENITNTEIFGNPICYIVFKDEVIDEMKKSTDQNKKLTEQKYFVGNYKNKNLRTVNEFEQKIENICQDYQSSHKGEYISFSLRNKFILSSSLGSVKLPLVTIGLYLATLTIIMSMAILSLKQSSDTCKSVYKYNILSNIGVTSKEIFKSLRKQVFVYLFYPLSLAIVSSSVAIYTFSKTMENWYSPVLIDSLIVPCFVVFGVYVLYFFATYVSCKSIVKRSLKIGRKIL